MKAMPVLVEALGGEAFVQGTAYSDHMHKGVALWLKPGVEGDESLIAPLLESTVESNRLPEIYELFEKLDASHPKAENLWYLPFLGVEPYYQNEGLGGRLMEHALLRVDADNCTAYLESSDPRNISLYLRYGFQALERIEVGSFNAVTPMIREARK